MYILMASLRFITCLLLYSGAVSAIAIQLPGTGVVTKSLISVVPVKPPTTSLPRVTVNSTIDQTRTLRLTRTILALPASPIVTAHSSLIGGIWPSHHHGLHTTHHASATTDPFLHISPTHFHTFPHFTLHMPIPIVPPTPTTLVSLHRHQPTHRPTHRPPPNRPANQSTIASTPPSPSSPSVDLPSLCANPTVRTISLPLLKRFYGTNNYPALQPFPGCVAPNPSQAFRAPDLLNCTVLGQQVQACQAQGKRVILAIIGSDVLADDTDTGLPHPPPNGNLTWHAPIPLPNPNNTRPSDTALNTHPTQPNLFLSNEQAQQFAATIWSLFGGGDWERADLRPLGPDVPGTNTTSGIDWLHRPLGDEVVLDGFEVGIPVAWGGSREQEFFGSLLGRLKTLAMRRTEEVMRKEYEVLGIGFY